jgi:hypothetical protein
MLMSNHDVFLYWCCDVLYIWHLTFCASTQGVRNKKRSHSGRENATTFVYPKNALTYKHTFKDTHSMDAVSAR